jgi:hypothetical protein
MTKRLLLITILLPAATTAKVAQSVFIDEMREHRDQVRALALDYFDTYPHFFSGLLDRNILDQYIELHDAPKIYTLAQLRSLGYRGASTISEILSEMHGSKLLAKDRGIIDRLNALEKIEKDRLLAIYQVSPLARKILEDVEIAADVTATRLSPKRRIELAIPQGSEGPVSWLLARGFISQAAIAMWMEFRYPAIAAGLQPSARSQIGELQCRGFFMH